MYNYRISIILFVVVLCISCEKEILINCLDGQGDEITEEIILQEIKGLSLVSDIELTLRQGLEQSIFITSHPNIINKIKKDGSVDGDRWNIGLRGCVKTDRPIELDVTLESLNFLEITGDADVNTDSTFSGLNDVEIRVSGDSKMKLDFGDFTNLETIITGDSDIDIIGSALSSKLRISGDADLDLDQLTVDSCEIQITGDVKMRVTVQERLDIKVTGDANICYFGDPNVFQQVVGDLNLSKCR